MGSKTHKLPLSSIENLPFTSKTNEEKPKISCVSQSRFDISKYCDLCEIYREELAPTSVSVATIQSTTQKVAIKKIYKNCLVNDFQKTQAVQECSLHHSLDHRNIVKAVEWGEDDDAYSLVLEYIDNPTYFKEKIEDNLNPVKNELKLKSYMHDVLQGLAYLHSKGIVHGDIKIENLLLNTNEDQEQPMPTVKLCDFGLSRKLDKDTGKFFMEFPVGSLSYMAPEIKAKAYVDEKIDIWALGVVLYKMAVAYKPTQITGYKYGSGPIPFRKVDWRKRSPELQYLIVQMLNTNPAERISAEEALLHPWFKEECLSQEIV